MVTMFVTQPLIGRHVSTARAHWPMMEQVTQHSIEVKCIFLDVNLDQRYGRGEDEFWETTE